MNSLSRLSLAFPLAFFTAPFAAAQSTYATPYAFTTVAGAAGSSGSSDGTLAGVRFRSPSAVAVDAAGNVYVADTSNHTIRKISREGVVSTLAGAAGSSGSSNGTGSAARFSYPAALAIDRAGTLYVCDARTVIRKVTAAGQVTTLAGEAEAYGWRDGPGAEARFSHALGIAVDGAGNVFVADSNNHCIRRVAADGTVTTVAGVPGSRGATNGPAATAQFYNPSVLALDAAGALYVGDDNYTVRVLGTDGVVVPLAGATGNSGVEDGSGSAARFRKVSGLAIDAAGNLHVADEYAGTIRKVTPAGVVTTVAGLANVYGFGDGLGGAARFNYPRGLAIDAAGDVLVADSSNHVIRKLTPAGMATTLAGTPRGQGASDGTGVAALLAFPVGLALGRDGTLFFSDGGHTIRKVGADGAVATVAGSAGLRGAVDGSGNAARFNAPAGVAADAAGNLYVADEDNHTIRRISATGVVTTVAGAAGQIGSSDGVGGAARFYSPTGVALDGAGILYVADRRNHTIRRIGADGTVSTWAGQAGSSGATDGAARAARFRDPYGVATDSSGTLYVSEEGNDTIRRIGSDGTVTTLAGREFRSGATDGTGADARFDGPRGLCVDAVGNVFVADADGHVIRRIAPGGIVTTLAGNGRSEAIDGIGSAARFYRPSGIVVDAVGVLHVADTGNSTIRRGVVAAPALTSPVRASAPLGQAFSYRITALGEPTGFSASGLPPGLSVDAATGVVSGVPTAAGEFAATLGASNSNGTGTATVVFYAGAPATVTLGGLDRTYDRAPKPVSVVTTPAGLAIHVTYDGSTTAPSAVGRYAVVAITGDATATGSATGTLTIAKGSQTITFQALRDRVLDGTAGETLSARATSGLAVSFSIVAGGAALQTVPTLTSGGTGPLRVAPTEPGTVTVRAVQPGNDFYEAAPPVERSFVVSTGSVYAAPHTFRTLAGFDYLAADGVGRAARFNSPTGVAVDAAGTLYVADYFNHTIRKITADGTVTVLAGSAGRSGFADGPGAAARFDLPTGIAVDAAGNVYVADFNNHTIRRITAEGVVSTLAGSGRRSGSVDGAGGSARFDRPTGVAVDRSGNVYVADQHNHTIRRINGAGVVTTWAGEADSSGATDGLATAARFNQPTGVAVAADGTVYVTEFSNHTVRRISPDGRVATVAGRAGSTGTADGAAGETRFNGPTGIAVDAAGVVFVAEYTSHTLRRIAPDGTVTTVAGTAGSPGSADGTASSARFDNPYGIAVDARGQIFVADISNHAIRRVASDGAVSTVAGQAERNPILDGTGAAARLGAAGGLAVDAAGTIFFADRERHVIRKISPGGAVSAVAGAAGSPGVTDGVGDAARFKRPNGLAVDRAGNVFVADEDNHTIRKITPTGAVALFAGRAGAIGAEDGAGTAARFHSPAGLAIDAAGNLYVADQGNDRVRKISPAGVVTTFFVGPRSTGLAVVRGGTPRLYSPTGVAVDAAGNVYVTDTANHAVRKISAAGVMTTLAGLPTSYTDLSQLYYSSYYTENRGAVDGPGASARFNSPRGVAVDGAGNVFVVDAGNHTVRRISASGAVSTVAGFAGSSGWQEGNGSAARFDFPTAIALDGAGRIVVADAGNFAVRVGEIAAPVLAGPAAVGLKLGLEFTLRPVFSGAVSGLEVSGLPPGLNFAATTGVIAGAPTAAGTYSVALRGMSEAGPVTATMTFTVDAPAPLGRLSNVSVRTTLGSGQSLTVGFTMQGGAKPVLVRAVGPGLGVLGVEGAMPNPALTLYASGTQVDGNDDWTGTGAMRAAFAATGAFALEPGSRDAVVLRSVAGGHTVVVAGSAVGGAGAGAGIVVVEVYDAGEGASPRLINLSALNHVGTGSNILIAGFTLTGTAPKTLLIRAVGPTLTQFGVGGTLDDPQLAVFSGATVMASNDNWSAAANAGAVATTATTVGAFALGTGSRDAALLVTLPPGGYTTQVSGVDGRTGAALVEVYEVP